MKKLFLVASALLLSATSAIAASSPKSYQVTGPVTDVSEKTITVQKGSEKWEIARDSAQLPADVKVGSKVTVYYTMSAAQIEDKSPKSSDASASEQPASSSDKKDAKEAKADSSKKDAKDASKLAPASGSPSSDSKSASKKAAH